MLDGVESNGWEALQDSPSQRFLSRRTPSSFPSTLHASPSWLIVGNQFLPGIALVYLFLNCYLLPSRLCSHGSVKSFHLVIFAFYSIFESCASSLRQIFPWLLSCLYVFFYLGIVQPLQVFKNNLVMTIIVWHGLNTERPVDISLVCKSYGMFCI